MTGLAAVRPGILKTRTAALPFSDNFNRSGAVGNGWVDTGTGGATTETTNGNTVGNHGIGNGGGSIARNFGTAEVDITALFTGADPAGGMDIGINSPVAVTQWLQFYVSNSGTSGLYKYVRASGGGLTPTLLASCANISGTVGTLRMVKSGPFVQCYRNGVLLVRHELAAANEPDGTYCGFGLYQQTVDSFSAASSVVRTDTFTRADSTGIGDPSGGGIYYESDLNNRFNIETNKAVARGPGAGYGFAWAHCALDRQDITVDITAPAGSGFWFVDLLCLNSTVAGKFRVQRDGSLNQIQVCYEPVGGGETVLTTFTDPHSGATATWRFLAVAGTTNTIFIFSNGVARTSAVSSVLNLTGRKVFGLLGQTGATFDNLVVVPG